MTHGSSDLLQSLSTTMTHQARLVRMAGISYTASRREAGLAVVQQAVEAFYDWRARQLVATGAHTLTSLVRAWGTADLLALNPQGWGHLAVHDGGLHLRVDSSPELRHYESHGVATFAALHYRALVGSLARAVGLASPVEVTWDGTCLELRAGQPPTADAERPGIALDGPDGLAMLKLTSEGRGGLLAHLGRHAELAFGADGEEMYREACRSFGAERGAAMRLEHLSRGLTLDLVNMMELYDSGGNEDVWQYRDEGVLTPVEWSQDCTFCPFVQSWKDLDALRYGQMYDHEFHHAQFKAYRQDIQVGWGELMSKGDATCEFRFSIPAPA